MDWFLYDNDLRHERVNDIDFINQSLAGIYLLFLKAI